MPENYHNVKEILSSLNFEVIEFTAAADIKMCKSRNILDEKSFLYFFKVEKIFIYYLNCFLLVLILTGKSGGKPKFGCPFCSACTPYMQDGELYSLGDLLELHQVFHFFLTFL